MSSEASLTRRELAAKTVQVAAGVGVASTGLAALDIAPVWAETPKNQSPPSVSPNEKVNIALIGCGGMGMGNLRAFRNSGQANIVALCDLDPSHLEATKKEFKPETYPEIQYVTDWRRVLDMRNVDVIINATPDHWHALPTIYACQVGKDVYVEKPLSHNIVEGRAMVNAARYYKRVVQGGTQQRTDPHFIEAVQYVQSGKLGHITVCRTWNTSNEHAGIGNPPDEPTAPPGVDYNMWLGPAPLRPFNPNRFHYTFRWFFDYAGGMMADWGVHLNDIVLWGMEVDSPNRVTATGGHWALPDNRDTPDTLDVTYEFDRGGGVNDKPFMLVYSLRKGNAKAWDGKGYGIAFYGTNGTLFVDRSGWEVIPEGGAIAGEKHSGHDSKDPHVRNFLDCVKGPRDAHGMRPLPASDVEIVHRSTTTCALGNIAVRTGQKIYWDRQKETCRDAHGRGIREANALLTRKARKPWTLPKVPKAS